MPSKRSKFSYYNLKNQFKIKFIDFLALGKSVIFTKSQGRNHNAPLLLEDLDCQENKFLGDNWRGDRISSENCRRNPSRFMR